MFDIGFWELAVIGVVALIVIGPERLPAVARTLGLWVGKARRFVSSVQSDISREMNKSEQLARLLEEQSKLKEMHEIIEQTVDETRKTVAVGNEKFQAPRHEPKPFHDDDENDDTALHHQSDSQSAHANVSTSKDAQAASVSPAQSAEAVNEKNQ